MEELFKLLQEKNLYIINSYYPFVPIIGKNAWKEINPYCLVRDDSEQIEKIYYAMLCRPSKLVYISINDIDKILFRENGEREIWIYSKKLNIVVSSNRIGFPQKVMHRTLKESLKNQPIFHINKNPLDNRNCNLRYRQSFFKSIKNMPNYFNSWFNKNRPDKIISKYCIYVNESCIEYDYFVIDNKHPALVRKGFDGEISSFKSYNMKKELIEKYLEIERAIYYIENYPEWNYEKLLEYMKN